MVAKLALFHVSTESFSTAVFRGHCVVPATAVWTRGMYGRGLRARAVQTGGLESRESEGTRRTHS